MEYDELEILYQDENIVAINKPAGLLVHRTRLDPGERRFAIQTLRNQIGSWVYPVHRLDKSTSGVLLFAKNNEAASTLGEIVLNRMLKKRYLALVRGFPPEVMNINYSIASSKEKEKKSALTHFRTLERTVLEESVGKFDTARYSLVEVFPETGRRHQIRKHLKHIYYPIIGDRRYGDRDHNRFFRENLEIEEMFLHASMLNFINPYTNEELTLIAKLPDYWLELSSKRKEFSVFLSHLNIIK